MRHRVNLATSAAVGLGLALTFVSTPASALSLGRLAPDRDAREARSGVHKVDLVTKCWETRNGRRRCRVFYVNPAKLWNPDRYPVGSTEWWRAMDRSGRGGSRF